MTVIHHTFGPFVDTPYFLAALRRLFAGKLATEQLRQRLENHFQKRAFLFDSGRSALLALLRALKLRPGEAVVIQGFTCAVLPNAIHAAGAVPLYADIDRRTLNLTVESVRKVITPQTRVIICQHTFGIPADVRGLRELCDDKQLFLIEDCAHIIPDRADAALGQLGDGVLLSFGRDKAISGVSGGAVLVKDSSLAEKLWQLEEQAPTLSPLQKLRLKLYPYIYWKAKWLWFIHLGKPYLYMMRLLHILPPVLTPEEKQGNQQPIINRIPNFCAALALYCFERLPAINEHRRTLGQKFRTAFPNALAESPAPQKVPLLHPQANDIVHTLKQHGVYLDDGWRGAVVNPPSSNQERMGYTPGSCPVAEKVSQEIISLPTHPTMSVRNAARLISILKHVSPADL